MALNNLSKLNNFVFLLMSLQILAKTSSNYVSDNAVSTRETPQQQFYTAIPQQYYIPYQKHISSKYVASQSESQVPVVASTTEKTLFSPAYKVTLDTSKYATPQLVKAGKGAQVYPYVYTVAKIVQPTPATYTLPTSAGSNYDHSEDVPKKYHYGYRVSNPHSGTEFGHSEVNDGLTAKGYYHVLLPDGRLQNVKYWAGPSGYHATITYETQY